MNDKVNRIWIAVTLIWIGVLSLTYWNVNTMDKIKKRGEKMELSRMENQFLKYNSENISRVLNKRASFFQTVESLKFGFLSVENQQKELAANHKLGDVKIEGHLDNASQGSMPIILSVKGTYETTLPILAHLQEKFPYLPVTSVRITPHRPQNQIQFQIWMNYRHSISTAESQLSLTLPSRKEPEWG